MNGSTQQPRRIPSGLLYAATVTPIYVEMAFLSADSFRQRYPHAPVVIFTDQPEHPLLKLGMFNFVFPIGTDAAVKADWSRGQLARILALPNSPFERTLHVDCDTRFVGDITPAITVLDRADIAMVECVPDRSLSCRKVGKRMFNAGVCSYRLTTTVQRLFWQWAADTLANFVRVGTPEASILPAWKALEHLSEAERHQFLGFDQTSLMRIWSPDTNILKVRGATLSYAYNCTFSAQDRNRTELPRIVSHPSFKETTLSDLLGLAQRWRTMGRGVEARQIVDYVSSQWIASPVSHLAEKRS